MKWIVAVFRRSFQRQRVAFEDIQDEESFATKLKETKNARKDVDEYGQLSLRDYVEKRLKVKKEELHSFTTTRGFTRNVLMGLVVSVTALATAFSAKVWRIKKDEELTSFIRVDSFSFVYSYCLAYFYAFLRARYKHSNYK